MATDFNSKYSGEQVEQLLDQVANGGTGGGESDIYIWEFNGSLEDGASGTIEREVLEKLAEAKSLWLRHEGSYTVCNYHVGDSSSVLFMLFTTIQQDVMSNCAITIDGETLQYNVAGYEISIQDAIFDLDDIRSGASKGATALQELPSEAVIHNEDGAVITQRGILVDNNVGMWYALPFTDDADRENADAILAWYTPSGDLILENGILVDNKEGHRYALPSASDEDKAGADSVIASEAYVDDKLDGKQPTLVSGENIKTINGVSIIGSGNIEISGGGGSSGGCSKEFVEVTPMQEPLGYYGDLGAIVPNNVYVFTKPIYALGVTAFEYSDSKGDEYSIMFTASEDNISIRMPLGANIYWANGVIPIINSGDLCELSLLRIGSDIKAVLTTFKAV